MEGVEFHPLVLVQRILNVRSLLIDSHPSADEPKADDHPGGCQEGQGEGGDDLGVLDGEGDGDEVRGR